MNHNLLINQAQVEHLMIGGGWLKPHLSHVTPSNNSQVHHSESSADTSHQQSTESDSLQSSPINNATSAESQETPPIFIKSNFFC